MTRCVDVPGLADIDEPAPPHLRTSLSKAHIGIGIIDTRYHNSRTRQPYQRRPESRRSGWKILSLRIGYCNEQSAADPDGRLREPVSHQQTSEAMSSNEDPRPGRSNGCFQGRQPLSEYRIVPIALLHPNKGGIAGFPQTLPVIRTGISDPGHGEYSVALSEQW
jgi:hypothetical protein